MKLQLFMLCLCISFTTQAQTWLGTISTDWNTAGNWQGGVVPGPDSTAIFDGTSVTNCAITGSISVGAIDMATGYTGTISIVTGSSITLTLGDFAQAAGTFNCGSGGFTLSSTSNFNCTGGTFIASSNTTVLGFNVNLQHSFQHNNGTLLLNSTVGATSFSVNGSAVDTATVYNLTVNLSSATNKCIIVPNNKIIVANTLHIVHGCLDGSISGTDTAGLILLGDLIDDQTGTNNNESSDIDIVFSGNASTTITMASGGEALFNGGITIQKNSAANSVTLNSPLVLDHTNNRINFVSGRLVTTAANILTIGIDGINLTNASNSSFVDGPMNKTGGGPLTNGFVFPIGASGIYAPIALSGSTTALSDYAAVVTDTFQAEYFHTDPNTLYNTANRDVTLTNVGRCEYWRLNKISNLNGSTAPYVWVSYDSARSCGISAPAALRVAKWDAAALPAAKWIDLGASTPVMISGVPYLPANTATSSFSPFNLASVDASANPLPLTLTKFEGTAKGQDVTLYWQTASEINVSHFTIERSSDGISFTDLDDVKAANTGNLLQEYLYNDVSLKAGRYYYRLRINDVNSDVTYSKVVSLQVKNSVVDFHVYPNPVDPRQGINLSISGYKGKGAFAILASIDGRQLIREAITFDNAGVAYLNVNQNIATGVYLLTVSTGTYNYRTKLYVK